MPQDDVSVFDGSISAMSYQRMIFEGMAFVDQIMVSLSYTMASSDTMAVSDAVSAGLIDDVFHTDTMTLSELLKAETLYNRAPLDSVLTTDEVYPWVNGSLQLGLIGDSDFNLVAMIRNPAPAFKPVPPPKTQVARRPANEPTHSFVVDPAPPRRRG